MGRIKDPDARDDQALEDYWKFQGTPGVWQSRGREIYSETRNHHLEVCENISVAKDRDLILQAKPLLEFCIKHRESLIVANLGSGHWRKEIEELTELIHKSLGHKKDGI